MGNMAYLTEACSDIGADNIQRVISWALDMPRLSCRLMTDGADPHLVEALAATDFQAQRSQVGQSGHGMELPKQARRLAQTAQPQLGVSNVSTDISCDGCSGTDTRSQARNAELAHLRGSVINPMFYEHLVNVAHPRSSLCCPAPTLSSA